MKNVSSNVQRSYIACQMKEHGMSLDNPEIGMNLRSKTLIASENVSGNKFLDQMHIIHPHKECFDNRPSRISTVHTPSSAMPTGTNTNFTHDQGHTKFCVGGYI